VLNGTLELHGLDVDPFAIRVVDATLRKRNIVISDAHRREELLAFVVAELWVASRKFDAQRYPSYEQFAAGVIQRKIIDYFRKELGRTVWKFGSYTYERSPVEVFSLDDRSERGLGEALEGSARDFADDRSPDLMRLLTG